MNVPISVLFWNSAQLFFSELHLNPLNYWFPCFYLITFTVRLVSARLPVSMFLIFHFLCLLNFSSNLNFSGYMFFMFRSISDYSGFYPCFACFFLFSARLPMWIWYHSFYIFCKNEFQSINIILIQWSMSEN